MISDGLFIEIVITFSSLFCLCCYVTAGDILTINVWFFWAVNTGRVLPYYRDRCISDVDFFLGSVAQEL